MPEYNTKDGSMTVSELVEKRKELEKNITNLIQEFINETGSVPDDIEYHKTYVLLCGDHTGKNEFSGVTVELKL